MLSLAQDAVQGTNLFRQGRIDQTQFSRQLQQGQIADIGSKLRILVGVSQHQVLHHEFDIHHAAAVVLDVKQLTVVWMTVVHLLSHAGNFAAQFHQIARQP